MSYMHNFSSQPHVLPHAVSSNRAHQQQCSTRTPGEGYPFPRVIKSRSNTITSVEKNSCQVVNPPKNPNRPKTSQFTIDMDVFKQLLAMEDNTESSPFSFTQGLIDLYYEDASRNLEQMRSTLHQNPPDFMALSRLAHFLRGSAASVGIIQVANICESIEMQIISKPDTLSNECFETRFQGIEQMHLISRKWFREFFNQHGPHNL